MINPGQIATLQTLAAQLRDFPFYTVLQQQLTQAIVEELNITKGDFVTLTPQEGKDLAAKAARRFLNQLRNP